MDLAGWHNERTCKNLKTFKGQKFRQPIVSPHWHPRCAMAYANRQCQEWMPWYESSASSGGFNGGGRLGRPRP